MEKVDALVGLLACPNDVTKYRDAAKRAFFDWNVQNCLDQKVFLLPINWADNARPEVGDAPQELINKQLLEKCDFLIGIFWQRLGTPTENAESGTVDEINNFIASGKSCMIYFSEQKENPGAVDPVEYKRLKEFKEKIKRKGVIKTVQSLNEFKNQLSRDLNKLVNEYKKKSKCNGLHTADSSGGGPVAPLSELEGKQANKLSDESKQLLMAACQSNSALITDLKHLAGHDFSAGNLKIGLAYSETRKIVKWEEAIEQLLSLNLIKHIGNEDGLFTPTSKGFELGEKLVKDQTK